MFGQRMEGIMDKFKIQSVDATGAILWEKVLEGFIEPRIGVDENGRGSLVLHTDDGKELEPVIANKLHDHFVWEKVA